MSMASTVNSAVKIAKKNLGDLILQGMIRRFLGSEYIDGEYVNQFDETAVDFIYDKFSFSEENDDSIDSSDVKIQVFNNDAGTLEIKLSDKIRLEDGREYEVKKYDPVRVGPYKPMITVILKS